LLPFDAVVLHKNIPIHTSINNRRHLNPYIYRQKSYNTY
jgi:hypothetical protein